MRLCTGLSSSQLTLLSWSSTTGRATDGKYLFWADFFLHNRKIMPNSDAQGWSVLTIRGQFSCHPLIKHIQPALLPESGSRHKEVSSTKWISLYTRRSFSVMGEAIVASRGDWKNRALTPLPPCPRHKKYAGAWNAPRKSCKTCLGHRLGLWLCLGFWWFAAFLRRQAFSTFSTSTRYLDWQPRFIKILAFKTAKVAGISELI